MEYIKPQMGDVLVNVAQIEEFENCNWHDAAQQGVGGLVGGAIGGCAVGAMAWGVGCGPGAVTGAIAGGLGGLGFYAATCWW